MHLINIFIFDAHIIQEEMGKKVDALSLKINLIEPIVDRYGRKVESAVKRRFGGPSLEAGLFVWQSGFSNIEPTESKNNPPKRCIVCHTHKIATESQYEFK